MFHTKWLLFHDVQRLTVDNDTGRVCRAIASFKNTMEATFYTVMPGARYMRKTDNVTVEFKSVSRWQKI